MSLDRRYYYGHDEITAAKAFAGGAFAQDQQSCPVVAHTLVRNAESPWVAPSTERGIEGRGKLPLIPAQCPRSIFPDASGWVSQ